MSNLQLRMLTAAALAPITILLIWFGGISFKLFAIAIGLAIFYEWTTLSATKQNIVTRLSGWLWLVFAALLLIAGYPALLLFGVLLFGSLILLIMGWQTGRAWAACGLIYAGVPMVCLALLRGDSAAGLIAIIYLFALVWATDIFAYFTGRSLGGPKLAPRFSPNKTWSGAIGGVVAAIVAAAVVSYFSFGYWKLSLIYLAGALSVASQVGDLSESWVKRQFGAKDSGRLLPGHGGVMDRVDGLIFAAVLLYLFSALIISADNPAGLMVG